MWEGPEAAKTTDMFKDLKEEVIWRPREDWKKIEIEQGLYSGL